MPPLPCLGRRRCRSPPRPPLFVPRIVRSRWVPRGHPYMAHSHCPNRIRRTGAAAPLSCRLCCRWYSPPVWRRWCDRPPLEKTCRGIYSVSVDESPSPSVDESPLPSTRTMYPCAGYPHLPYPLPQTGGVCTTVPGRRRSWARYQPATRCGGFVVAPLLRDVPQQRGDEQRFRCDDAGSLRDGGVGGVVGSG